MTTGESDTTSTDTASTDTASTTVAEQLAEMFTALFAGAPPVPIEFWDGSVLGGHAGTGGATVGGGGDDGGGHDRGGGGRDGGPGRVVIRRVDALRRLAWSPDELGIAWAFVSGDIDLNGELAPLLRSVQDTLPTSARIATAALPKVAAGVRSVGALGRPLPPPPEEFVARGVRHSQRRDKSTVSHHYDVGNDFYRLVLGPAMTYSCARFVDPDASLEDAQAAKHDLICRKLGIDDPATAAGRARPRLLDVGCGWGSMAIHAAAAYGADVVGVTISDEQAALARERVEAAGSPPGWRSGCRTTGRWRTVRSMRSRRSGWPNTSARRTWWGTSGSCTACCGPAAV